MPPKRDRPRSSSGPMSRAGWGPFASSSRSSAEDFPTTPLPVTYDQFDQRDTAILPVWQTPLPPALRRPLTTRQLSSSGITRQLSHSGIGGGSEGAEGNPARGPMLIQAD